MGLYYYRVKVRILNNVNIINNERSFLSIIMNMQPKHRKLLIGVAFCDWISEWQPFDLLKILFGEGVTHLVLIFSYVYLNTILKPIKQNIKNKYYRLYKCFGRLLVLFCLIGIFLNFFSNYFIVYLYPVSDTNTN